MQNILRNLYLSLHYLQTLSKVKGCGAEEDGVSSLPLRADEGTKLMFFFKKEMCDSIRVTCPHHRH